MKKAIIAGIKVFFLGFVISFIGGLILISDAPASFYLSAIMIAILFLCGVVTVFSLLILNEIKSLRNKQ